MQSNQSIIAAYLATNPSDSVVVGNGRVTSALHAALFGHASQSSGSTRSTSTLSSSSNVINFRTNRDSNMGGIVPSAVFADASSTRLSTSDDALNVAHQETVELLNQYYSRQDQIERREKVLLEQRLASLLGPRHMLHVANPSSFQAQQQQLTASRPNANSETLLFELLRQKYEQDRQAIVLKQLQGLPLSSVASAFSESASLTASPSLSTRQLQHQSHRLQQLDEQNKISLFLRHSSLGASSGISATTIHSGLRSNFLRDLQQASAIATTSTAIDHISQQNAVANVLPGNVATISLPSLLSDIDRKPAANANARLAATGRSQYRGGKKVESKTIHRIGRVGKFPLKLYTLLNDLKEQGRTDLAAFVPHGRSFGIFNTAEFARDIMPRHFRMSRYSSFQRQLNLYDFQRITEGPDKGTYQHPLFIEGQPNILCRMKRNKIKGIVGVTQLHQRELEETKSNFSPSTATVTNTMETERDEQSEINDKESDSTSIRLAVSYT